MRKGSAHQVIGPLVHLPADTLPLDEPTSGWLDKAIYQGGQL